MGNRNSSNPALTCHAAEEPPTSAPSNVSPIRASSRSRTRYSSNELYRGSFISHGSLPRGDDCLSSPRVPPLVTEEEDNSKNSMLRKEGSENSRTSGKWCPLRERKVDLIDISPLAKSGQYQPLKKRPSVSSKRREDSIREEEDSIDPSEHQRPESRTDRQTRSTTHAEKANTAKPVGLTTDTSKEHSHESSGAMDTTIPKRVTSTSAAPESETAPKIPVKEEEKAKSRESNSDARQIGHSSSTSGPSETEEAKICCKAQKHDSGRKANPSSESIRSNIFTDSNNWVDEDAVFAWKVLVVHALHQRKEEVSCYSNSTIKELKEAYIFSMKGSHNTNLFKLQKGIYYLLPEHWTLHPMVRNRSTVYAFEGTKEELDRALKKKHHRLKELLSPAEGLCAALTRTLEKQLDFDVTSPKK